MAHLVYTVYRACARYNIKTHMHTISRQNYKLRSKVCIEEWENKFEYTTDQKLADAAT